MSLAWRKLKPRGGKLQQFLTWFVYGVVAGAGAGILVGVIWVSVEWIFTVRSGSRPAWAWVKMVYQIGAMLFGLGGAVLGAIVGSAVGILEIFESKRKDI